MRCEDHRAPTSERRAPRSLATLCSRTVKGNVLIPLQLNCDDDVLHDRGHIGYRGVQRCLVLCGVTAGTARPTSRVVEMMVTSTVEQHCMDGAVRMTFVSSIVVMTMVGSIVEQRCIDGSYGAVRMTFMSSVVVMKMVSTVEQRCIYGAVRMTFMSSVVVVVMSRVSGVVLSFVLPAGKDVGKTWDCVRRCWNRAKECRECENT